MTVTAQQDEGQIGGAAFAFVQRLAGELSSGKLELPSSPEIVMRVRDALRDPNVTAARLARVVGSEPALAARIMHLAASFAMNPEGRKVADLRHAITMMGFNNLRSAAMAFAIAQLRDAARLKHVRERLTEVWMQSLMVASVCQATARRHASLNADEAMLAGLMHGVGKLYILGRADTCPELFDDAASLGQVLRDWHASIGKAILEAWGFPEAVAEAVGQQDDIERAVFGHVDLTDVLIVSVIMASYAGYPADLEFNLHGVRSLSRLGLDGPTCAAVLKDAESEVQSLRIALGA
ncbi:MAG: HDOD domain-containing protein [Steroidobacteraceae bacterium]|jgi:HD-like signal output (HDOD) protein|nr:HDOD domain-containing protein [Steroidobacteraceae bacterium]